MADDFYQPVAAQRSHELRADAAQDQVAVALLQPEGELLQLVQNGRVDRVRALQAHPCSVACGGVGTLEESEIHT